MKVKAYIIDNSGDLEIRMNEVDIKQEEIKVVMVNEVAASCEGEDFYSTQAQSSYEQSVLHLFQRCGMPVTSLEELQNEGIYVTNAIKRPKQGNAIEPSMIEAYSFALAKELALFPNVKVIMLMGDVAKKAYTYINKREGKKRVIPAGSTYKIRKQSYYDGEIRVIPSYIMTGKNLLIEKSKQTMIIEDIQVMWDCKTSADGILR